MTTILQLLMAKNVVASLDDKAMYSRDCEQHTQDIRVVFDSQWKCKHFLHLMKYAIFIKRVAIRRRKLANQPSTLVRSMLFFQEVGFSFNNGNVL